MSNEDGSEDRLTMAEFAELIQHLSVQEILTIEYRIDNNWNKLFARKSVLSSAYVCNLCVLETSSFKSLLSHIDGRKHRLQMNRVKQLHHPDYTYSKNYKNEFGSKKNENISVNCTTNNESESTPENKSFQSKEQIQICKTKSDSNLEPKNTATIDKNKESNYTMKTPTIIENENETIESPAISDDIKKNPSTKNKEEDNTNSPSNITETKIMSPVVVVKRSLSVFEEEVEKKKPKIVIKSVIAGKTSFSDKNMKEMVDVEKSKNVINPASYLSLNANSTSGNKDNNEGNEEKPRYQTGKIIIPTVHKSKSNNDTSTSSSITNKYHHSNDLPKFSVKSYSSKPCDNDIYGILGVEYVIKVLKSPNDISPRYECGLCELVLDGFAMQKHLEGYNHRLKFCEKHFPTAIRHYRQYMQHVPESELFKVMTPVLAKLAVAIEQHHGRNLPYECYERDFNINRHEILAKAFSCRHASEQYGSTFTHVVSSKEIDEFISNRHKYLPPTSSRSAIFDTKHGSSCSRADMRHQSSRTSDKETNSRHRHAGRENSISNVSKHTNTHKSYMSTGLHDEIYPSSGCYNHTDNRHVARHVDDETYNLMVDDFLKGILRDHRKLSTSPVRKSLPPLRQNDIWQTYRNMVDQELHNLEERFKQYRKDPETHPSYNEEWQKFWKRRKDELVSAGLDHRKYNYQPEWVRFIKIRMEELYGQEVENIKIKSRERLCLPMSNDNVPDEKYHVNATAINTSNETVTSTINSSIVPINTPTSLTSLPPIDNIPQVVSVLRLMTALEDSLGSLGPKIIELLSKALHAEKNNPSHVNALILNDENCSLIETAKEKFKGLIITGLFEGSKKRVLKQVVNDAEALLRYAYQYHELLISQRSSIESSINQTQKNLPFLHHTSNANISSIIQNQSSQIVTSNTLIKKCHSTKTDNTLSRLDKKELASKLAASLVAQGKTDFDPQQLQQLIAVYKLIEKKKRENVETAPSKKSNSSLSESLLPSKKTLSDTLLDILKSSNSSSKDANKLIATQTNEEISNQLFRSGIFSNVVDGFQPKNSVISSASQNCITSTSQTSVLQNSNDYYFHNTAQSVVNTYITNGAESPLKQPNDYGLHYSNNVIPHQQNSSVANIYNNQYLDNGITQSWGWNSNVEMNQNYNMSGPPGPNNYSQNNWRNF